ncbi:predicted protein [Enterococcus faecalis HIP11704]|nr:predicted protein [Enterococcus faecalis HIP11704]
MPLSLFDVTFDNSSISKTAADALIVPEVTAILTGIANDVNNKPLDIAKLSILRFVHFLC